MTHRDYLLSLETFGIKLGLDQIRALLVALDHPERAARTIVVAGTNGKGSVAAMIEHGLRAGGYRTGRYTSPHLAHLEERFTIDGTPVTSEALDDAAGHVRRAADALASPPSFFEATTAAAFLLFRDAGVDVAVLEVGLGGRLDATNVTRPAAVAITQIARDHEAQLGTSLAGIAAEKAAVIAEGSLVVAAPNPPEVQAVIRRAALDTGAALVDAYDDVDVTARVEDGVTRLTLSTPKRRYEDVVLALRGRHQIDNAVVATRLLEALGTRDILPVGPDAVRAALEQVSWPGRLDLRAWRGRPVLVDGAHNPAGADALASYVMETWDRPLPMIVAMMKDKDVDAMLRALAPASSRWVFTAPRSHRAAPPADLAARARVLFPDMPVALAPDAAAALELATTGTTDPVVVAGSLYLAGEVIAQVA